MYYQTPGMQPPGYLPRAKLKTEEGLKFFYWALIIYIVGMVLSVIIAIAFLLLSSFGTSINESYSIIESIVIGMVVGALALVVAILGIIGFINMRHGQREFGETHAKNVKNATRFLVTAIVLMVVSVIVSIMIAVSAMAPYGQTPNPYQMFDSLYTSVVVTGAIGIIATAFMALMIVYLVIELSTDRHRKMLWAAFALIIVNAVLGYFFSLLIMWEMSLEIGTLDAQEIYSFQSTYGNIGYIPGIIGIIAFVLVLICYRSAYYRVKNGEIKPHQVRIAEYYPREDYPQSSYEQPRYRPPSR